MHFTTGAFSAMRAHKLISKSPLLGNMRPINVSLDSVTWKLAKKKTNFSQWVRDKLRSEDNKISPEQQRMQRECIMQCGRPRFNRLYCAFCAIKQGKTELGEEE